MPRRRFRYDRTLGEMVEITYVEEDSSSGAPMVHGDIPAFVSPLDGSVVEGRRAYEEHMRKHNVVPFEQGSEKKNQPAQSRSPQARQELRERLWEYVDKAVQRGPNRRINN